jgi:FKBP-type peptidyl-prolyl cis-trans isomerase
MRFPQRSAALCGLFVLLTLLTRATAQEKKVVTTPSGLQYEDLKVGTGDAVKSGDFVEVHYTGWLKADGSKFDSSVDRKKPFITPIGMRKVIQGWDEGVVGMKPGGKRKLTIPFNLAYGERGRPPVIPAKADLVFEIELLRVLEGVKTEDLKAGTGAEAKKGDTVEVLYTGWLKSNGKKFDSSVGGEPFSFKLGAGQVIAGWDAGVAGMKVGGKRKLTIPAHLGYGERGAGDDIPPNSDLVFEVELLKVK